MIEKNLQKFRILNVALHDDYEKKCRHLYKGLDLMTRLQQASEQHTTNKAEKDLICEAIEFLKESEA